MISEKLFKDFTSREGFRVLALPLDGSVGQLTCCANSLVGAKTRAWQFLSLTVFSFCRIAIENVAVLPVPDWAWAITSFPEIK